MTLIGLALTPFTARLGERFGRPSLIATGLAAMTSGLVVLLCCPPRPRRGHSARS
jgi:DHA2 family methylenomycin A resistance protein-like MFS transporter